MKPAIFAEVGTLLDLVSNEDQNRESLGSDLPASGREFALYQNLPNPFNQSTSISYSIDNPSKVRLSIFSISGQEIRVLVDRNESAGTHTVRWDGRDNRGHQVSSGLYLYRLQTNTKRLVRKMILSK